MSAAQSGRRGRAPGGDDDRVRSVLLHEGGVDVHADTHIDARAAAFDLEAVHHAGEFAAARSGGGRADLTTQGGGALAQGDPVPALRGGRGGAQAGRSATDDQHAPAGDRRIG